jgi:hypothetical protein
MKEVKRMNVPFMKQVAWYLIVAMFIIGIAPKVDAGLAPSEVINLTQPDRSVDLQKIQKILETKAISERLTQFGLTHEEIMNKLSQLSDQQIHKIALQLDDLKVGQDSGLGIIIALLVIAILVVLLLQLTGHKVIITK